MEPSQNVPPSYKPDVDTIAEMFSVDHSTAFMCLKNANYNKERAIQKLINPDFTQPSFYSSIRAVSAMGQSLDRAINVQQRQAGEQMYRQKQSRRAQFDSGGRPVNKFQEYKKTYMIKKKQKPKKQSNRRKQKGKATPESAESKGKIVEQLTFIQQLDRLLQSQIAISFRSDLFDVFKEMHDQKKLVALHNLKFLEQKDNKNQDLTILEEYIKNLYKIPEFVGSINKAFINFGLDSSKFDFQHYPFMKNFIKPTADDFTIVVLRYNQRSNTVDVFRKLRINMIFKLSEKERFGAIINELVTQSNRAVYNATIGIKPLTEFQKLKIEEDRLIREHQQKEYLMNKKLKEQMQKQQQQQLKKEVQIKETVQEKRAKIREQLKLYVQQNLQNPIYFKIRLPSGWVVSLTLPRQEKIEYLFDYIFCQDEQKVGFQNPKELNFQILQPFDKVFLSARKHEQIGNVFQGSDMETLVVKENW